MQGEMTGVNGVSMSTEPVSTEVLVRNGRRRFTTKYIEAVLKELDEAPHGEKGMILRRDGLYSAQIQQWRKRQATESEPKKRGRKESSSKELQQKLTKLEREKHRLVRKLERAEKVIAFQKKGVRVSRDARREHRAAIMKHVETRDMDLPVSIACESLSLAKSTFYYRCSVAAPRPEPAPVRPRPRRALGDDERAAAYSVLTSQAYIDKSPAQIVANLLDNGRYLCSERTLDRILHEHEAVCERRSISHTIHHTARQNSWQQHPVRCGHGTSPSSWDPVEATRTTSLSYSICGSAGTQIC